MTVLPSPSRERLSEIFVTLARIPSPSRAERRVADAVISVLEETGVKVREDGTGAAIGGDCGNLICVIGNVDSVPCLALGAHLDTVPPGSGIEPVLDSADSFRNSKDGILGADDKAAVAALLHAVELLTQSGGRHATFEMFFTVCEEQGLVGAKHLERNNIRSPVAAVLDGAGPVGGIVVGAPSQKIIKARFKGQAAHAGEDPETGLNAVQAAAKAVAAMSLGRLDEETTANIGIIRGGEATNVVPELCEIEGECRSHDEKKLTKVAGTMVDMIHEAAAEVGVDVEVSLVDEFRAFRLDAEAPVVRLAKRAIVSAGLTPSLLKAGGGCDANVLNGWGLPTVNLTTGMTHVHSSKESVALDDLERLCQVVLQTIALAEEDAAILATATP